MKLKQLVERKATPRPAQEGLQAGMPYSEIADSDEVARAFRDDVARYSDLMSPGVRCLAGG
jgi:hypothetical protein